MLPTETVYAASNLLVFLNDRIIQSSLAPSDGASSKFRVWLTVLEYLEVIIELSAQKIWGRYLCHSKLDLQGVVVFGDSFPTVTHLTVVGRIRW